MGGKQTGQDKTASDLKKGKGSAQLLSLLKVRFEQHGHRHPKLTWKVVEALLSEHVLGKVAMMESSGGEPDVMVLTPDKQLWMVDCCLQSPVKRRSLCYDHQAWQERKQARPKSNVMDEVAAMGVTLLTEQDYRALQRVQEVDTTTSSWLLTPLAIRERGGALFGDRRYDHVFVYHNGASSYYAARGFRTKLALTP